MEKMYELKTMFDQVNILLWSCSASMGALCFGMSMGLGPKLDLDAAAAENQAFMVTRNTERQEMVALNDRLAAYIEKARVLNSTTHTDTHIGAFNVLYC